MHPRIEKLTSLVKESNPNPLLHVDTLIFLKDKGVTRTEAALTLFLGFGIPDTEADEFVNSSKIWEPEDINAIFDQTLIYCFYVPNDPKYQVTENKISVPLNLKGK
jgi:hypothetical protein